MIKYKYFFGSDSRSVRFLSILNNEYSSLVVLTLPPIKKGRGRKLTMYHYKIENVDINTSVNEIIDIIYKLEER